MKQLLLAAALVALPLGAHAAPTTVTFNYTGAAQTFNVPAGVTSVTIEARGAQGGAVSSSPAPQGGLGATDGRRVRGQRRRGADRRRRRSRQARHVFERRRRRIGGRPIRHAADRRRRRRRRRLSGSQLRGPARGRDVRRGCRRRRVAAAGGVGGAAGGDTVWQDVNISRGGKGWNSGASGSFGADGVSANTTPRTAASAWAAAAGQVGEGYCNCGGGGGGYSGGGAAWDQSIRAAGADRTTSARTSRTRPATTREMAPSSSPTTLARSRRRSRRWIPGRCCWSPRCSASPGVVFARRNA